MSRSVPKCPVPNTEMSKSVPKCPGTEMSRIPDQVGRNMANDIPSSQMLHPTTVWYNRRYENWVWGMILIRLHPTSHKEEHTNYRKLRNDGTYSINCTPIPILRSRTVRRPGMGATYQQGNLKGKQSPWFSEKKHRQMPSGYQGKSLPYTCSPTPWIVISSMGPIQKTTYQLHQNGPEKSCPIRHIYIQSRTRDGH